MKTAITYYAALGGLALVAAALATGMWWVVALALIGFPLGYLCARPGKPDAIRKEQP